MTPYSEQKNNPITNPLKTPKISEVPKVPSEVPKVPTCLLLHEQACQLHLPIRGKKKEETQELAKWLNVWKTRELQDEMSCS